MQEIYIASVLTPNLGEICFAVAEQGLVAVQFPLGLAQFAGQVEASFGLAPRQNPQKTAAYAAQLQEYAAGERQVFEMEIDWARMRPFQRRALQETARIPYGQTRTYGQIAAALGNPRASKAVGRAQATNPLPLVIPCHRVLGANGSLHGYGAGKGLETKQALLVMEKNHA